MKKVVNYKLIFEGSNIDLYYASNHMLFADWYGYNTIASVKEGGLAVLQMAELYDCRISINDNRRLLGTWNPALKWIEESLLPRMIELGFEKIAHIYSEDIAAQYSIDKLKESEESSFIQVFSDFNDAVTWLTGHSVNEPITAGSCTFKTTEGLKQVDYRDIFFFSKHDGKTIVQTSEEQIKVPNSLSDLSSNLPDKHFMRVHKSYIVNLGKIKELKYHAGGYYRASFNDLAKFS